MHIDDLGGVDDRDPLRQTAAGRGGGLYLAFLSHKDNLQIGSGPDGLEGPLDDLAGGVVAAHGVYDDFHFLLPSSAHGAGSFFSCERKEPKDRLRNYVP